jgi:hypothetical protein
MPAILKDSRFWMGAAAGFFVGPMVAKFARMQLTRIRAASGGQA